MAAYRERDKFPSLPLLASVAVVVGDPVRGSMTIVTIVAIVTIVTIVAIVGVCGGQASQFKKTAAVPGIDVCQEVLLAARLYLRVW